jgi:hypothetical protein
MRSLFDWWHRAIEMIVGCLPPPPNRLAPVPIPVCEPDLD